MDHEIKLGWAKDKDGKARFIMEVENGKACGCFCPSELCRRPLVARCNIPGKIYGQTAHFAHEPGTPCAGGALESALHLAAKRIFLELAANKESVSLPEIVATAEVQSDEGWHDPVVKRYPLDNQISSARVEVMLEHVGRRPDALLVMGNGDEIAIEICVTNPKSASEIATYETASFPALEIELKNIPWDITPENLRHVVAKTAERTWLYHPAIMQMQAEAEAEARLKREAANKLSKEKEARREIDLRTTTEWLEKELLDWLSKGARWELSGLEWPTFHMAYPGPKNGAPKPDTLIISPRITKVTLDPAPRAEGARIGEGHVEVQRNGTPSKTSIPIFVSHWDKVGKLEAESPTLRIIVDPRPTRSPYRVEWHGIGSWKKRWKEYLQAQALALRSEYMKQFQRGSETWMSRANEQERMEYFAELFGTEPSPESPKILRWDASLPVWKAMLWKGLFANGNPGDRVQLRDMESWIERRWRMHSIDDKDTMRRYTDLKMWLESLLRAGVLSREVHPPLASGKPYEQAFTIKKTTGVIPWEY